VGDGSKISMTGSINATSSTGDLVGGLEGNAVVQFGTDAEAFVGTVSSKIEDGFNSVEVLGNSDVLFENSFNTNRLTISDGAQVSLALGTSFETLTLVGDFTETSNSISLDAIFGDTTGVVLSAFEDNTTALTVIDSNGQEWTTENLSFNESNSVSFDLGTAIPEPSTYALIFGVLALGFVVYRRRK